MLGEFQTGTPVIVYLGPFSGGALIANPATSWSGRMDRPQVDIDGRTSSISINCESRLLSMNVAVDRRYTPDDQQRDWPGDLGLKWRFQDRSPITGRPDTISESSIFYCGPSM